jgi:hypothetical protein
MRGVNLPELIVDRPWKCFPQNNKPQGFNLESLEKWVVWDSNPELIS